MDFRQAVGFLDAHTNLEGSRRSSGDALPTAGHTEGLSLAPIAELLSILGDPHRAYRTIHITGTNGKGSVARFASALLKATSLSVGTFTSPDLERINERISWDGQPIPDEDFASVMTLIAGVEPQMEHRLGRFDLLAAAAYIWFAELGVDVAVIEVGMLGRFDSTNVIEADVAVITNIGKDHTDGAEGWRSAVAGEKAGIISPTSRVVLGEPFVDLRPLIDAERPLEVWEAETDFAVTDNQLAVGGRAVSLRTPGASYEEIFLPVHGDHQASNLATAVAAVEAFFDRPLDQNVIETGLDGIELPGRFEIMRREPTIVLDGAHNREGARAAKETLDGAFARLGSWVLVFGMLTGKDPAELLEAIEAADFDAVIITQPSWSRALPAVEVANAAAALGISVEVVPDAVEAFHRARTVTANDDLILVAGSLYLIGELRPVARSVIDDD